MIFGIRSDKNDSLLLLQKSLQLRLQLLDVLLQIHRLVVVPLFVSVPSLLKLFVGYLQFVFDVGLLSFKQYRLGFQLFEPLPELPVLRELLFFLGVLDALLVQHLLFPDFLYNFILDALQQKTSLYALYAHLSDQLVEKFQVDVEANRADSGEPGVPGVELVLQLMS